MPLSEYLITEEPYYQPVGNEITQYIAAHADRMPIVLKGPTGCGKTRFIEHMAWKLKVPMITVSCHEDMTASDLVGRFLLDAEGTVWHDGPLTLSVRHGATVPASACSSDSRTYLAWTCGLTSPPII